MTTYEPSQDFLSAQAVQDQARLAFHSACVAFIAGELTLTQFRAARLLRAEANKTYTDAVEREAGRQVAHE